MTPVIKVLKKCRVLIGLSLFGFIVLKLDLMQFFSLLPRCRYPPLILVFTASVIIMMLMTFRWHLILRFTNIRYGYVQSGISLVKGLVLGEVTPGRLGEFLRAVYLSRHTGTPTGQAIFSVVLDRLYDIFTLCFMGVAGIVFITNSFFLNLDVPWVLMAICIVLFAAVALLLTQERVASILIKPAFNILLPEKKRQQAQVHFEAFFKGYRDLTLKRHAYCLACSICIWSIKFALLYFLTLALNIPIPFLFAISLGALAVLVSLIPISISGLGTREALFIYMLDAFQIQTAAAVMLSLFYVIIPFLAIFPYFLLLKMIERSPAA